MFQHKHPDIVERHVRELSYAYTAVDLHPNFEFIIVNGFRLPPGWNRQVTSVFVNISYDYPESPPGLSSDGVLLPSDLRKNGRMPPNFYPGHDNEYGRWGWWCYQRIAWDPHRDDLISLLERIRADMA